MDEINLQNSANIAASLGGGSGIVGDASSPANTGLCTSTGTKAKVSQ